MVCGLLKLPLAGADEVGRMSPGATAAYLTCVYASAVYGLVALYQFVVGVLIMFLVTGEVEAVARYSDRIEMPLSIACMGCVPDVLGLMVLRHVQNSLLPLHLAQVRRDGTKSVTNSTL